MTDLDVIEHADTPIGTIFLGRRDVIGIADPVYEIQIDAQLLMSSLEPISERQLATSALALHQGPGPLRVLVGGLGLGYTAEAALVSDRVGHVRIVEKMDFVIDWMQRGLLPLSEQLANDKRVEIIKGDVYDDLLADPTETYDLILIDVDHAPDDPLSAASDPFYTVVGQQRVARHLNPGGILAVWSGTDNDDFAAILEEVYTDAQREEVRWESLEPHEMEFHNFLFFGRAVADEMPSQSTVRS